MAIAVDLVFDSCGKLAIAGWLTLVVSPLFGRFRGLAARIAGFGVPLLIAIVYSVLIIRHFPGAEGGFGSINAVRTLFQSDPLLVAGWIHYLAFDLFVGGWIVRDAQARGIAHWLVLPFLPLTFLFGPMGLLAYGALVAARRALSRTARMAGGAA